MLFVISSIFDPIGFIALTILITRRVLQGFSKTKCDWAEKIEELAKMWWHWWQNILVLNDFCMPHCFKSSLYKSVKTTEIHCFADASSYVYGACLYLRLVDCENNITCWLTAKSRLAPIKAISIPRLELTSAILAVRLNSIACKELDVPASSSFFWTDSTAVLLSLCNTTKRFPTFVANRLSIIEKNRDKNQWNHVSSKLIPADPASRGYSDEALLKCEKWMHGPQFLQENASQWPMQPIQSHELPPEFFPVTKQNLFTRITKVVLLSQTVDQLIESCSMLDKLKRMVG